MRYKTFLAGAALCAMTSCIGEVVNEYCNYQCLFYFDGTMHAASPLAGSLNSPNSFVMVSTAPAAVGYDLIVGAYGGESHHEPITTEPETRPARVLGLNNALVIGRSSLQDGDLYVFDRQCPNCYTESHTTKAPLSWTASGTQLHCKKCDRSYGLLNGGVVMSGENGEKLFRYRCTFFNNIFKIVNPL